MSLLIEEYRKRIIDLDAKIEKLQNQMIPLQTHTLFLDFEAKLKSNLEKMNEYILIKKDKKFQRSKRAFQDGKAYKWKSNQTNKCNLSNVSKVNR